MNERPEGKKNEAETVTPGPAVESDEGADVMQTVTEANEKDDQVRDDMQDEDIISLDTPD